ncbi:DNA-binding CsgD family transcriptional regulator/CDP-diglyceride synthetase [Pedobacter sp. UYP30]|uniref:response regulator transcription factor n=1 Tax=Pedobacter sp. UYP30 TaxID=1756400 RepID=UPI00339A8771
MRVFGTEMLLVTFIFVVLETVMFFYQFIYFLSRPQDKQRLYYLILLFLLLLYNTAGGLFPDESINMPIVAQNVLAYGSGFLMASYFPYYFYKGFGLERLRFHSLYGVPLFLILPFLIFFVIVYSFDQNLEFAVKYGMIIPFFYSFVVLWAILRAIKIKYREHESRNKLVEITAVYAAVVPWLMISVIAYFNWGQLTEVLFTNCGFLVITILFICRSVTKARIEFEQLSQISANDDRTDIFDKNAGRYNLTNREVEIIRLIKHGYKYQLIGEMLFISTHTVKAHLRNVFEKTGASNRVEVLHILEE